MSKTFCLEFYRNHQKSSFQFDMPFSSRVMMLHCLQFFVVLFTLTDEFQDIYSDNKDILSISCLLYFKAALVCFSHHPRAQVPL